MEMNQIHSYNLKKKKKKKKKEKKEVIKFQILIFVQKVYYMVIGKTRFMNLDYFTKKRERDRLN